MELIILTKEQLQEITNGITTRLDNLEKNFQPKEPSQYLTRQEVADMLKVNLSTIHNWCKKGKLKPLGVGARVYFLREDVEKCLTPISL